MRVRLVGLGSRGSSWPRLKPTNWVDWSCGTAIRLSSNGPATGLREARTAGNARDRVVAAWLAGQVASAGNSNVSRCPAPVLRTGKGRPGHWGARFRSCWSPGRSLVVEQAQGRLQGAADALRGTSQTEFPEMSRRERELVQIDGRLRRRRDRASRDSSPRVGPINPRSVAWASVAPVCGLTVNWAIVTGSEELASDVQNGFVADESSWLNTKSRLLPQFRLTWYVPAGRGAFSGMITSVELPFWTTFSTAGGWLKPKTVPAGPSSWKSALPSIVIDQSRERDGKLTGDRVDVGLVERDHQLLALAWGRLELDRRDSGRQGQRLTAHAGTPGIRVRGIRRPAVVGRERRRQLMTFPRVFRYPPVVTSTVAGRQVRSRDRRSWRPGEHLVGCAGTIAGHCVFYGKHRFSIGQHAA